MGEASAEIAVVGDDVRFLSSTSAGDCPTDIGAAKLHELDEKLVKERMFEVTRWLVKLGDVRVICLGCAPMSGLNRVVKQACISELGEVQGSRVKIVDGVIAGVLLLDSMLRLDCYFPPQSDLEPFPSNIQINTERGEIVV